MSLEEFAPHIGAGFVLSADEAAEPVGSVVLIEAERSPRAGANGRPFSLVFEGPADLRLDQATYWLAREGGEPRAIFLVPLTPRRYEAIFN